MLKTLKNRKWGRQPILCEYRLCSHRQAAVVVLHLLFSMWLMKNFRQELQNLFMISFPVQPLVFISMEGTSLSYTQYEAGKQKGIGNKQCKAKE